MELVRLSDYVIGPRTGHMVWMIFAAVALLWVLACANVAGLQTARSVARRHEMGTRLALGASTRRLFAQTLVESAVLACAGFVLGLLIAQYAVAAIGNLAADSLPRLAGLHIDPMTIAIALVCMLVSTFMVTVFSGRRPELTGGREISRRDRGRDVLIVAQVALASTLLLATSLLLHSFIRLRAVDPGFDPERILTVHVNLPRYDSVRRVAFFRNAPERLTRLPQVESVGATNVAPFSGWGTRTSVRRPGPRRFARGSDSQ
jgi:putative ABC transport system permease protein